MRSLMIIGMMLGLTAAGAQTGARKKAVEKKAIDPAPSKPAPQDFSWRQWGGPNRDFKPASQAWTISLGNFSARNARAMLRFASGDVRSCRATYSASARLNACSAWMYSRRISRSSPLLIASV